MQPRGCALMIIGADREVRRHGRLGKVKAKCQFGGVNWMSCSKRSLCLTFLSRHISIAAYGSDHMVFKSECHRTALRLQTYVHPVFRCIRFCQSPNLICVYILKVIDGFWIWLWSLWARFITYFSWIWNQSLSYFFRKLILHNIDTCR
jgi:hypothetical protein